MNNKIIFRQLAITLCATSLCAGEPSKQELQEQLAAKQQELHELSEKIIRQEAFIEENYHMVNKCVEKVLGEKIILDKPEYKRMLTNLNDFHKQFLQSRKKNTLLNEFRREDSLTAFAKFHYVRFFYEHVHLEELIRQWEETVEQINVLLDQMDYWAKFNIETGRHTC